VFNSVRYIVEVFLLYCTFKPQTCYLTHTNNLGGGGEGEGPN